MLLPLFQPLLQRGVYYYFVQSAAASEYLRRHCPLACPIVCLTEKNGAQTAEIAIRYPFHCAEISPEGLRQKTALLLLRHLIPVEAGLMLRWPAEILCREQTVATVSNEVIPTDTGADCLISIRIYPGDVVPADGGLLNDCLNALNHWQDMPYLSLEDTRFWHEYDSDAGHAPAEILGIDQKGRQIRMNDRQLTFIASP